MLGLWVWAYCIIIATEIPFVAIAVIMVAICRPRIWLAIPVLLYIVGLHWVYDKEFNGSAFTLWNPWHHVQALNAAALVHGIASILLLGMTLCTAVATYRWRRKIVSLPKRGHIALGTTVLAGLIVAFFCSPSVLGLHYNVTVEGKSLGNPVRIAEWYPQGIRLEDGRCVLFEYPILNNGFCVDNSVELVPAMDTPDQVSVFAKTEVAFVVDLPYREPPLLTIPLLKKEIPRYSRTLIDAKGKLVTADVLKDAKE